MNIEKVKIETRIELLKARKRDNQAIIAKLQRKLRKLG
jgi:hypothetical protein